MPQSVIGPLVVFGLFAFFIALLTGRILLTPFRHADVRLGKLLATIGLGSSLLAVFTGLLRGAGDRSDQIVIRGFAAGAAFLFPFLGSAWGWQTIRRKGESRGGARLRLLVQGWMLVAGGLGATGSGLFLLIAAPVWLFGRKPDLWPSILTAGIAFPISVALCLPAFATERSLRQGRPRGTGRTAP